jgi:hypothetical protein
MTPIVFRQMQQQIDQAEAAGTDAARLQAYQALRIIIHWLGLGPVDGSAGAEPASAPEPPENKSRLGGPLFAG